MQVTPIGDKLQLLPDNEPGESGQSEHLVFRQAVIELLVKAARTEGRKLTAEQTISIGNYVMHSDVHETTEETAPVVSPAEAYAYLDALAFASLYEDQEYASLARGMMETLNTELTIEREIRFFPDDSSFFFH